MFFYRAWVINDVERLTGLENNPENPVLLHQFQLYRWGYGVLLGLTMAACLVLNTLFLASFFINGLTGPRKAPNTALLCLSVRDLLVCLVCLPIFLDWYVVNSGYFTAGAGLCKFTAFLDHFLMAQYPILILALGLVLLTRRFPQRDDPLDALQDDNFMALEDRSVVRSHQGSRQGSRPPSVASGPRGGGSRAPSVVGSVDGYHRGGGGGSRNGYRSTPVQSPPRRPGSVTGSIEGRLAGTPRGGRPPLAGTRVAQLQQQEVKRGFMASSPLPEEDEDVGDATDLWESASLDYPGRNPGEGGGNSPTGWEFMEEEDFSFEEPHYYTWHLWFLGLTWTLGLCVGIPAALLAKYDQPDNSNYNYQTDNYQEDNYQSDNFNFREPRRPGCYIPVVPFKDAYAYSINDPGFLYNLSVVILMYFVMTLFALVLIIVVCVRRTKNSKYRRYVKILICLTVTFFVSRAPMDFKQLMGLIEAARGFKVINQLSYEREYEIILVWAVYAPIVLHPIFYLCFVSEFRKGAMAAIRGLFGCQAPPPEGDVHYKEQEILDNRSTVSKTQVSNML